MIVGNAGSDAYIMRDEYILIEASGILHLFDISLLISLYNNDDTRDNFSNIFDFNKISLMSRDRQILECNAREESDIYSWLSNGKTNVVEVTGWLDSMIKLSGMTNDDVKNTRLLEGIYIISQSNFTKAIDIIVRSEAERQYVVYLMNKCTIKNYNIISDIDNIDYSVYTNIFIGNIDYLNHILDNHEDKLDGKELIISDIRSNLTTEYGIVYPNIKIDPEKVIYKKYNITCIGVLDRVDDIAYG